MTLERRQINHVLQRVMLALNFPAQRLLRIILWRGSQPVALPVEDVILAVGNEHHVDRTGQIPLQNVLQGYLTGAIDMVFVADGKYYILDWKSNWLGASPEDYSQEALRGEIERKHYALQYVIYLTALKRHLMATAGLTQETVWNAIGGAFYVFVRGVNAQCALDEKGRRTGVYFDCPREAVDALDALLGDSND